jgi:hydroxyacylglutathione hydrolase
VLFERFEDKGLAQYSYAVGCSSTGQIAIVDPRRDLDAYLEYAVAHHARITQVLETHIHADFASGARALAAQTGATLHLSAYDRGELYEVSFPHEPVRDGDRLVLGRVRLEAVHTPGHTPEHLSFLVYDTARSGTVPEILLTGDFLFVGSLGRPDLIGEDVKRTLAGRQHDSVQKLCGLPDGLEIHPGHGAGSMCGAGLGGRPMSTLGFERIANPYLDPTLTRDAFIARLLGHVPPFPPYYRRMKTLNAAGADAYERGRAARAIAAAEFEALVNAGHVVVDLRDPVAFSDGHIPGSFGIGEGTNLSTWASWVVPYDTPILFVTDHQDHLEASACALARVGLDDIRGHLDGGIEAWRRKGLPISRLARRTPKELVGDLSAASSPRIIDVRSDDEWAAGHVCGATHVMGGYVHDRAEALGAEGPLALICGTGYRSTVAASVLERAGVTSVINVIGGMQAWEAAGLPVCRD